MPAWPIGRRRTQDEDRMIIEVTGDILLTQAQAIAHGVAPNDPFNSGLALQLRERSPAMYKDFRHYCQTARAEAGGLWAWMGADGRRIVALFTQDGGYEHGAKPGKATPAHVAHALKALRRLAAEEAFTSIALPRLATGAGGLDWSEVAPLLHQHLGDLGVPVYVYTTYRQGVRGAESAKAA
jgi:O-acetyl-ADP-ribose deacetylase (regulator of RNase III)